MNVDKISMFACWENGMGDCEKLRNVVSFSGNVR